MKELNNNAKNATKTIFCDIDGTLVKFPDNVEDFKDIPKGNIPMEVLPGALDKLWEWETQGYRIILTTGRKESMRSITEKLLTDSGIFWDQLVMGLGPGKRYLVNDINNGENTAYAINVERNHGLGSVNLESSDYNTKSLSSCTLNYEDVCCSPPENRGEVLNTRPYDKDIYKEDADYVIKHMNQKAEKEAIRIAEMRHKEALSKHYE
jgi:hypothetical protein